MLSVWNHSALPSFDRLFDDVMNGVAGTSLGASSASRAYNPAVDVRATAEEIVFLCDVPGLKQDDVTITLEGSTLCIKGRRRYEGAASDQVWLGRSYGEFEKLFTLPELVEADQMAAQLADGVLTIRVPKKAQARPRRIEIATSTPEKQLGERRE